MRFLFTAIGSVLGLVFGIIVFFDAWTFTGLVLMTGFSILLGAVLGFGVDSARLGRRLRALIAFVVFVVTVMIAVAGSGSIVEWECARPALQENMFTGECVQGCVRPWYWVTAGEECIARMEEERQARLEFIRPRCEEQGHDDLESCPLWNG